MLDVMRPLIAECIIVDDASSIKLDSFYNNIQLIYHNANIKLVRHSTNKGPAASRNSGFVVANSDILLCIDSDVCCNEDCVRLLYQHIRDCDITFPTILYNDGSHKTPQNYKFCQEHCMDSAMFMIKRSSLSKLDCYFDEDIRIGEDFDFFLRAYIFGLKSMYVKEAIAYHPVKNTFTAADLRNDLQYPLYARLKLIGTCKYHIPWSITICILLLTHLLGVLTGKRIVLFSDIKPAIYSSSKKALIMAYCKAIHWNAVQRINILKKRRTLHKAIINNKQALGNE